MSEWDIYEQAQNLTLKLAYSQSCHTNSFEFYEIDFVVSCKEAIYPFVIENEVKQS